MPTDQRAHERRDDNSDTRGRSSAGGGGLSAAEAAKAGLGHVMELTEKKPEAVTSVEPAEDGWIVDVEVLEERRIPTSADTLAVYQVDLDLDGSLLSYRRTARYARSRHFDRNAEAS